jgi:hypothetical protein
MSLLKFCKLPLPVKKSCCFIVAAGSDARAIASASEIVATVKWAEDISQTLQNVSLNNLDGNIYNGYFLFTCNGS